ncbi:Pre-mRNA-splicing factor 18 [Orchesella cincta]|uniref:Pre-mRNA-splicing factor 18 n=1 Tax=Orchesella cincta TaxID=48709 RepID=A0A1D2MK26_ORCCI|nr:Pre-mRNA-splicing factor 18 [Orchesella cincta]
MDILKKEIERKRKQLEDANLVGGEKKYFKRGELIAKNEEDYLKRHGLIKASQDSAEAGRAAAIAITVLHHQIKIRSRSIMVYFIKDGEGGAHSTSEGKIDDLPQLSRREVMRRLRERGEPILLYGETEMEAFKRLRKLEILEPEVNRGFRNDFQAALEQVDQAYLEEILKTTKSSDTGLGNDSKKKLGDVHVTDDDFTYDDIVTKTKETLSTSTDMEQLAKAMLQWWRYVLKSWGKHLNSRPEEEKLSMRGKLASATYTQTQEYLRPLFQKLKSNKLSDDILECLKDIVMYMLDKNYIKATMHILEMAIGNAPWPIGVTMVGIHARTGREKIFSKNLAHVMNDETQRKYIQGLKRLMTKCQQLFPTNPSKSVEYVPETIINNSSSYN